VPLLHKLLIVDDEYFIRYGLEHTVEWEEYGIELVGSVKNGIEALEYIKKYEPDIVITDIKMPEMDGVELIRQIRKQFTGIKVIVISGYDDFEYVKESLVYGVENYILKPINEDELSGTLVNVVDKIENEESEKSRYINNKKLIRENLFCRIISNTISSRELKERMNFLGIKMLADSYVIGVLSMIDDQNNEMNSFEEIEKLYAVINKNIMSEIPNHVFCDLSGNLVILICKSEATNYKQVKNLIQKITALVNKKFNKKTFATIGDEQSELSKIYLSYNHAMQLQKYSLMYPANSKLCYPEVIKKKEKLKNIYKVDSNEIKECILKDDKKDIENFYNKLRQKLLSFDCLVEGHLESLFLDIMAVLIYIMKDNDMWKNNKIFKVETLFDKIYKEKKIEKKYTGCIIYH
jgi:two-component system, response regulator YesN